MRFRRMPRASPPVLNGPRGAAIDEWIDHHLDHWATDPDRWPPTGETVVDLLPAPEWCAERFRLLPTDASRFWDLLDQSPRAVTTRTWRHTGVAVFTSGSLRKAHLRGGVVWGSDEFGIRDESPVEAFLAEAVPIQLAGPLERHLHGELILSKQRAEQDLRYG